MSSNYTPAQEQVADIFERFQEHDKLYGKSVRDDKYIWRQVDSMWRNYRTEIRSM